STHCARIAHRSCGTAQGSCTSSLRTGPFICMPAEMRLMNSRANEPDRGLSCRQSDRRSIERLLCILHFALCIGSVVAHADIRPLVGTYSLTKVRQGDTLQRIARHAD